MADGRLAWSKVDNRRLIAVPSLLKLLAPATQAGALKQETPIRPQPPMLEPPGDFAAEGRVMRRRRVNLGRLPHLIDFDWGVIAIMHVAAKARKRQEHAILLAKACVTHDTLENLAPVCPIAAGALAASRAGMEQIMRLILAIFRRRIGGLPEDDGEALAAILAMEAPPAEVVGHAEALVALTL
jgi:hypothetical protein